ncbi:uncharacterized protein LOC112461385 isoform X2 [Temnothorax curvispinosus]|uniref:Uncharacterized protein LOC112461385 isoform X2 n=1 Tax=Temnothorax curvispinosus TaxID=300111 RepID=A0A6J1QIZ5_9HYME|nr:uncharacterized protein LOC112461385 isoform X2 [Temnothorax curvispinosus]
MQSRNYKRRLHRKIEKERQKRIIRSEVIRTVTQVQKSFGEESSELDKNLNENLDRIEHARESHDFEYEMNNDSFVADSEEREWSTSDNSAIDYDENEQSGSTSDNDDDVFQFPNNEAKEVYVTETIREWALEGGVISMTKLNDLLLRLHVVHPTLPKSYKSLLKTPSDLNIIETDQAEIWYKGIRFNLDAMLLEEYLETYHQICIDVNMDGLPISKSSLLKFWPILGRLIDSENEPFVISIYFGRTDPTDVRSFLNNFVNEVEDLFQNGYTFNEITYPFVIRNFILDAPARSLVKCCIGHGGYGSCEKCTVIGETVHSRRVYLELDKPLRTDESFKNREQPLHHCGQSPLEQINIGMVSQFRHLSKGFCKKTKITKRMENV